LTRKSLAHGRPTFSALPRVRGQQKIRRISAWVVSRIPEGLCQ
jgi:hypothetical protein